MTESTRSAESPLPADDEFVRWHHFRPWLDGYATRPHQVIDPCGDCGKAKTDHPIPSLRTDEATARELLRLRAVVTGARTMPEQPNTAESATTDPTEDGSVMGHAVFAYSWGHGPADSVNCGGHNWYLPDPGGGRSDDHPWWYLCTNEGCHLMTPFCNTCTRPVADGGKETGCAACKRRLRESLPTFEEMLADPTFQVPIDLPPTIYPHPAPSDTAGRCGCATCASGAPHSARIAARDDASEAQQSDGGGA